MKSTQQKPGSMHSVGLKQAVQMNWATPNTMDHLPSRSFDAMKRQATNGGRKNRQRPGNLREQIDPEMQKAYDEARAENNKMNWPTASVAGCVEGGIAKNIKMTDKGFKATRENGVEYGAKLRDSVIHHEKNWGTPRTDGSRSYDAFGGEKKPKLGLQAEMNDSGQHNVDNHLLDKEYKKRINPRWVEQLMGLEVGHCTFGEGNRTDELRLLGNGVVPQTAERAFLVLMDKLIKIGDISDEISGCF